ncbi:MAG: HlyD family efflux transporter periplasmic adaptor subunit, partial [Flavobacterium sp.]
IISTQFISYPDTVHEKSFLTSEYSPQKVRLSNSGMLKAILVKDQEYVKKDSIIGWLESDVNYREIQKLIGQLKETETALIKNQSNLGAVKYFSLINKFGDQTLQDAFSKFLSSILRYEAFTGRGYYQKQLNFFKGQVQNHQQHESALAAKMSSVLADYSLSQKQLQRDSLLLSKKLLTEIDLIQEHGMVVSKRNNMRDMDISLLGVKANVNNALNSMDELEHQYNEARLLALEGLELFKNTLNKWIEDHSIRAPSSGIFESTPNAQPNQFIEAGKHIGYVVPRKSKYYFTSFLKQSSISKISLGDQVDIRLESYPYRDYGSLSGQVLSISNVGLDSGYACKIILKNSLTTTLNKQIPYRETLFGEAIFTTKKSTLLEKLTKGFFKN